MRIPSLVDCIFSHANFNGSLHRLNTVFPLYCPKTHQFHSNESLTNISIQVILYIYNLTMVVTNYTKLPHWTVQVISPIITCVSSQNTKLYGIFSLWGFQKSINCNTAESSVLFKSRFTSLKAGNNTYNE